MLLINSRPAQPDCSVNAVLFSTARHPSKILHKHISRRVSRADFSRKWKYAHVVVQFYILGFNLIHSLFFNVVLSSGLTLPRNFSVRTYVKIVRQLKSAFIRVPYQQIHGQAGCKEKEKFKY